MERRLSTRYPVCLDCTAASRRRPKAQFPGRTVNMSSRGILVSFSDADRGKGIFGLGNSARLIVGLPKVPYFRGCSLDCLCHVVRVKEISDALLVAFEVRRSHFRPTVPRS